MWGKIMWFLMKVSIANALQVPLTFTLYSNDSSVLKSSGHERDKDEVNFLLFTRKNPSYHQKLIINDTASLLSSNFNFNQSTKVLVHGWISHEEVTKAFEDLKNAYVDASNFNVITVDWNGLADNQYKIAHAFVGIVTLQLIELLKFLIANKVSTTKIHLIGHSLGAHIVGMAGKYFRKQKKMIDAITGLDPAYPFYKFSTKEERLDKTDAGYVEVIHTSGGYWGFRSPLGYIDFYPNGGKAQPGCERDDKGHCDHLRAVNYYSESIKFSTPFTSLYAENNFAIYYYVDTTLNMSGLNLNYGAKEGMYFFRTKNQSPFAAGHPDNWVEGSVPSNALTSRSQEKIKRMNMPDPNKIEVYTSDKIMS